MPFPVEGEDWGVSNTHMKQRTFWDCCEEDDVNGLLEFLDDGTNVNERNDVGETPLHICGKLSLL